MLLILQLRCGSHAQKLYRMESLLKFTFKTIQIQTYTVYPGHLLKHPVREMIVPLLDFVSLPLA